MKYSAIALGAFLVAAVSAQPHGRNPHAHRHADKHAKRELVIVTDYVDITETVLLTATVWVDGKGNTIAPPITGEAVSTAQGNPISSSHSPAVFFEPAPTPTAAPPPPPPAPKVEEPKPSPPPPPPAPKVEEPKPSPPPPPPTPIVEEPKPSPPPPPPAPKVEEPKPQAPPPPAPIVEEPKPQAPPPPPPAPVVEEPKPVVQAPSPPVEQAAAPQAAPVTGSISGPCAPGSPCTGDITFYQAGLGACGETHNGLSESVVALPHGMMGTQSNGNPFCGRMVSITKNGKTTSAKVVDKCMGCEDGDLDLSEKAFAALGVDQSVGRTTAEWHFTS